jgi:hypothetical protein
MNNVLRQSRFTNTVLHLVPGLILLVVYIVVAPRVAKANYPSILAVFIGVGCVVIFQIGYLIYQSRQRSLPLAVGLAIRPRAYLGFSCVPANFTVPAS